jgi:hypothetical protein
MFDNIRYLRPYFFSLREIDNNVSLDIKLPVTWKFETIISQYKSIKYKIQDKNEKFNLVSLISNATFDGYEIVFSCAKEIITVNKEYEEKQKLLQSKIKELEILFQHESLDKLKELTFIEHAKQQEDTTVIRMVEQGDGEGFERNHDSQESTN